MATGIHPATATPDFTLCTRTTLPAYVRIVHRQKKLCNKPCTKLRSTKINVTKAATLSLYQTILTQHFQETIHSFALFFSSKPPASSPIDAPPQKCPPSSPSQSPSRRCASSSARPPSRAPPSGTQNPPRNSLPSQTPSIQRQPQPLQSEFLGQIL